MRILFIAALAIAAAFDHSWGIFVVCVLGAVFLALVQDTKL